MAGCIVGWSHGKFGKREGLDLEALIAEVAVQAMDDAGVAPGDVD
ncbi:MAG: thiolase domain-containing protein, partial [Alphaproteobacteria bacterium]|nr:thiolase domain-containing protein [Alphaproteobacteria bacterium]